MKYIPNAMKFDNQSRASSLIKNVIFEIADLDPKWKTWGDVVSKLQCVTIFMKFGTQNKSIMLIINILLELTLNYKFAKFGPKTEIFSYFYEILHSQQIWHANHEYNTRQCLKRSRDYWFRMIIGCFNPLIVYGTFQLLLPCYGLFRMVPFFTSNGVTICRFNFK